MDRLWMQAGTSLEGAGSARERFVQREETTMASMLFNTKEVQKAAEIEFTNAFNKQRVVLAGFA